jgi:hypothetical protein
LNFLLVFCLFTDAGVKLVKPWVLYGGASQKASLSSMSRCRAIDLFAEAVLREQAPADVSAPYLHRS